MCGGGSKVCGGGSKVCSGGSKVCVVEEVRCVWWRKCGVYTLGLVWVSKNVIVEVLLL